jgi:ABC-2 type transport system permease protein
VTPSRLSLILTVVRKDLRLWTRDRFIFMISTLGLVMYVILFWLLPAEVDETLRLGVTGEGAAQLEAGIAKMAAEQGADDTDGFELLVFESRDALVAELEEGDKDLFAGLVLPGGLQQAAARGEKLQLEVIVDHRTPIEVEAIAEVAVREMFLAIAGAPLPVEPIDDDGAILGTDRAGAQISAKSHARPFLALLVLAMEMMALGSLVSKELSGRTVTALLSTPLRLSDFLLAKGLVGLVLSFGQAFLLALLVGALPLAPIKIPLLLLLGAMTFVGMGLIAGAKGRDFTEVLFWSMLFLIPSMLPGFSVLIPGSTSPFVMALPSYPVIVAMHGAVAKGLGFVELLPYIGASLAWAVGLFVLGMLFLMRKVKQL